jgi:hypothetical protein
MEYEPKEAVVLLQSTPLLLDAWLRANRGDETFSAPHRKAIERHKRLIFAVPVTLKQFATEPHGDERSLSVLNS